MGVNGSNTKGFAPICGNNGVAVTTTGTEIELDCSSVTTGKAMQIDCDGLTTGTALEIRIDSDVVTTGKAINVLSGSDMDTSVFSVDEDGDVVAAGSVTFGGTTLTVTGSELNALDGNAQNAAFTVGSETGNTITIAVQINDGASSPAAIAKRQGLFWYLSSDSTGDTLATAPTGGIAAGTDGTLIETLDNQAGYVITEADGDADFVLTDSGTNNFYLNIVMPNGDIKTSAVASFLT